jgi:integration host factor subunit alpha
MTLRKAGLIDSVRRQMTFTRSYSTRMIESLLEIIKQTLESGEDILITGFGKFSVKDKGKRNGWNPQTGDDLVLRARRVVRFKYSGVLRDRVNGKG